jgi:hypothetical protein
MPPITLHMVLARRLALDIDEDGLASNHGPYLLGATTPDIRVLTRQDRFSTHYFDLNGPDHQDSVGAFFAQQTHLEDPGALNPETRAFVAGYVSHLVMDQQYITGVYRPFFARHDALGGQIRANIMDRVLQFDMDRTHGSDPELKQHLASALACTVENIQCGFIESETLDKWREVTRDIALRGMDWDRMRSMVTNHLRFTGLEEGESLTGFLDSLPELLDETIAHVTSAEIDAFVQRSTDMARAAVMRYLECG